jgi:hypothetical protein
MSQLERLEYATSAGAGDLGGDQGGLEEGAEDQSAGVADGTSQQSLSLIRALHTNADVVACQVRPHALTCIVPPPTEQLVSGRQLNVGRPSWICATGWFQADWHYQRGEYQRCYEVAQGLLETDPYHLTCLPVYLAATLELRRKNELFLRAHKLMEEYPDR